MSAEPKTTWISNNLSYSYSTHLSTGCTKYISVYLQLLVDLVSAQLCPEMLPSLEVDIVISMGAFCKVLPVKKGQYTCILKSDRGKHSVKCASKNELLYLHPKNSGLRFVQMYLECFHYRQRVPLRCGTLFNRRLLRLSCSDFPPSIRHTFGDGLVDTASHQ